MTNRRNWIGSDELWCIIKIWSVDEFEPSMENICISQSWSYSIFWWWIRIYWCTWTSHLKRSAYFFPFKQSIGSFSQLSICVFSILLLEDIFFFCNEDTSTVPHFLHGIVQLSPQRMWQIHCHFIFWWFLWWALQWLVAH